MTKNTRGGEQVNSAHGSTIKKKKVQYTHSFERTDFERQLALKQTSGDPSPLSVVDVLLTAIDTRRFKQENRS